jgi:hypothetical protein
MKGFSITATALRPTILGAVGKAWDEVSVSFDRFCLAAGIRGLLRWLIFRRDPRAPRNSLALSRGSVWSRSI